MKICENCNNEHEGTYGSGRFCSTKCSRGFSTKAKRIEINEKISDKLTGHGNENVKINCCHCGKEFEKPWHKRNQLSCSRTCASKFKWNNEEYRNNISLINSKIAKQKHADGNTSFGWKTRKLLVPSYPESIAIKTLNSANIAFEYEMPLNKYFVDFAIHDKMIAIEIDGRQHKKPERKRTDDLKDALLKEKGWTVYRINWPEDNIIESIKRIFNIT